MASEGNAEQARTCKSESVGFGDALLHSKTNEAADGDMQTARQSCRAKSVDPARQTKRGPSSRIEQILDSDSPFIEIENRARANGIDERRSLKNPSHAGWSNTKLPCRITNLRKRAASSLNLSPRAPARKSGRRKRAEKARGSFMAHGSLAVRVRLTGIGFGF